MVFKPLFSDMKIEPSLVLSEPQACVYLLEIKQRIKEVTR